MKRWIVTLVFSVLPFLGAFARETAGDTFVEQLQKRDSILIADQLRYGVHLQGIQQGSGLALPQVQDTIMRNIIVVEGWQLDTLKTNRKDKTQDLRASMVITSFDEGEYLLPGIPVVIRRPDGKQDTLLFKGSDVLFCTMPVDTATFQIHDIKGQMKYPLTFREVLPWLGLALLLAAIGAGIWWFVKEQRRKREEAMQHDPAHIVALRKLDGYRSDKYWAAPKQKAFYSGVTDALREYMCARYGIGAMEMTTAEIFRALKDSDIPDDLKKDLKDLFERSDYVKFAKYVADDNENASVLPLSVRFVTTTYQKEVEGDSSNVL